MLNKRINAIKGITFCLILFFSTLLTGMVIVFAAFNINSDSGVKIRFEPGPILSSASIKNAIETTGEIERVVFDYDSEEYDFIKENSTKTIINLLDNVILYKCNDEDGVTCGYILCPNEMCAPENCSSLFSGLSTNVKEIVFKNFNTSLTAKMDRMFYNCNKLTNITFDGDFNTGSVTDMSYMFYNCTNLTTINFGSKFNTSNVTNMLSMFNGCSNIAEFDLSCF